MNGPDPAFIRRLEDDSLWSRDADEESRRQAERRAARYSRTSDAEQKRADRRRARQARRITVLVLIIVAVLIAIAGLEMKASEFGAETGGRSTPFSLLPLESIQNTLTTDAATTSTTSPATTSQ